MRYPSNKKFFWAIVIILLLAAGGFAVYKVFYLKNPEQKQAEQNANELSVKQPVIAVEINKNGYNDASDWEKALQQTISSSPSAGAGAGNGQNSPRVEPPSTLTEALAQNFYSNFMSARRSASQTGNNTLSAADQTDIANSFWNLLGNFKEMGRMVYDKTDVKISSSDDPASIKDYGNSLALIIKKYFDPLPENEMDIYKRAVTNQDADELKKLKPIANAYSNVAREMLLLEIPPSYAVEDLYLANSFNAIAEELNIMQKTFEDPARALLAFGRFKQLAVVARFILRDLNTYFEGKKIVFETGEPAEFFKIYLQ